MIAILIISSIILVPVAILIMFAPARRILNTKDKSSKQMFATSVKSFRNK